MLRCDAMEKEKSSHITKDTQLTTDNKKKCPGKESRPLTQLERRNLSFNVDITQWRIG